MRGIKPGEVGSEESGLNSPTAKAGRADFLSFPPAFRLHFTHALLLGKSKSTIKSEGRQINPTAIAGRVVLAFSPD